MLSDWLHEVLSTALDLPWLGVCSCLHAVPVGSIDGGKRAEMMNLPGFYG